MALLATAEKLVASGADFIIIPCNTAHAFLPQVQKHITIPILSMIEVTAQYIRTNYPNINRVGLLATTGTIISRVYADTFQKYQLEILSPMQEIQESAVMQAIYGPEGIKAGHKTGQPLILLCRVAQELINRGSQLVIMGCTEIPLVLSNTDLGVPLIDPTDILAEAAVKYAVNLPSPP